MKRLGEFFEEDNGSLSATRLAFLAWSVGVLVMWLIETYRSNALQTLDQSIIMVLGVLMTGKVVQKFKEAPAEDPADPPSGANKAANPAQPQSP